MGKKNGHSPSETWIKTKLELARLLGISRPTLDAHTVLPGFPQVEARGWPLERCRAFTAVQINRREETRLLELELLKEQVAQAQMRTGREAGELLPIDWTKRVLAHQAICFRNIIQGSGLTDEQKDAMTNAVLAIDCEEFIRQMALEAGASNEQNENRNS
jgi:hypothetical protein